MVPPEAFRIITEDVNGPGSGFQMCENFVFKDIDIPGGGLDKRRAGKEKQEVSSAGPRGP